MRNLLKSPTVVDEYFRTETDMWHALKSVPFSTHVRQCVRKGVSLSLTDWLRFVTLIPFSLSMRQLIRVFEEEDTVTALTSVCAPPTAQQAAHTITASNHHTDLLEQSASHWSRTNIVGTMALAMSLDRAHCCMLTADLKD